MINYPHQRKQQARTSGSWSVPAAAHVKNNYSPTHSARLNQKNPWNPSHHWGPSPVQYHQQPPHHQHRSWYAAATSNGRYPYMQNEILPPAHYKCSEKSNAVIPAEVNTDSKRYPAKQGDRWRPDTHMSGNVRGTMAEYHGKKHRWNQRLPPLRHKAVVHKPSQEGIMLAAAAVAAEPALIDVTKGLAFLARRKEWTTTVWLPSQFDAWVVSSMNSAESVEHDEGGAGSHSCALPTATVHLLVDIISQCDTKHRKEHSSNKTLGKSPKK